MLELDRDDALCRNGGYTLGYSRAPGTATCDRPAGGVVDLASARRRALINEFLLARLKALPWWFSVQPNGSIYAEANQ